MLLVDRCFCAPFHSRTLHVYPAGTGQRNAVLTVDRPGRDCVICCAPKPCLGACAVLPWCRDGVNIFDGFVTGDPGHLKGDLISELKVPVGGGGCTPVIVVDPNDPKGTPSGFIEGPMCFGGWSELCCESKFSYSTSKGANDIAKIQSLKPTECAEVCYELFSNADDYVVNFNTGATTEMKADAIAATLFIDIMFFEQDKGMCHFDGSFCHCTCFVCLCFGTICPFNISIPVYRPYMTGIGTRRHGTFGASTSAEGAIGAPVCVETATDGVTPEAPMERD